MAGESTPRLVPGRDLIVGGVKIDYGLGLAGHSDADVLSHAVADAVLGAAGLDDIGHHFPDSDPSCKDISSLVILKRVAGMAADLGFKVLNLDSVIIAQAPKMASYHERIRINLAESLGIDPENVSVKATTTEGLGLTGRGEGIAAQAVVLLGPADI